MTTEYDRHIDACAASLVAAMRRNMTRPYVVAVPTKGAAEPGRLCVISETEPVPAGGAIVRPCDNRASLHTDWRTVPYSDVRHVLWHACRREPILAIA